MLQQVIVFITILLALVFFIDGRIRYDIVALMALLTVTVVGIISPSEAFLGFGHPAIVTVAAILVVSKGLLNTGAVDSLVGWLDSTHQSTPIQIGALMTMTALFSSFMNNVGALALVMPIAIKVAKKREIPTSSLLMPVAFASLLGGLITIIGTPPNLIISMFRYQNGLQPFSFFAFLPVGLGLTIVGIIYVSFLGYKLIPKRKSQSPTEELFNVEGYLSEVCVPNDSKLTGMTLKEMGSIIKVDVNILGIVRGDKTLLAPSGNEILAANDILIVRTDTNDLMSFIETTGFGLAGVKCEKGINMKLLASTDYSLLEAVVRDDSPLVGKNAKSLQLRWRYGVNLVAVSRQGERLSKRLSDITFKPGDIVLILLQTGSAQVSLMELRCLPLAERDLIKTSIHSTSKTIIAIGLFVSAIIATSIGWIPVQISFTLAAVGMVLTGNISTKEIYESIDWPIIILLGAMLPLGNALEITGGAETIANLLLKGTNVLSPAIMLAILMLVTMLLTNVINNAAAAVLMAPIAINMATGMAVSPDPMLMAVAVASSSAYLTPIGHQSNTLVMGPGGYQFGDYWKLGLPLSIVTLILGTPLILWFWPF